MKNPKHSDSVTSNSDKRDFRERPHRITSMPVKDVLSTRMFELGIKNIDLQKHLGLPSPNVISMMKKGTMRLPIQHATKVASYLQIDKLAFLRKVVEENDPALWDAFEEATGSLVLLSSNELKLLQATRQSLDGFDADLMKSESFIAAYKKILKDVLQQEIEIKMSLLMRIDGFPALSSEI